MKIEQKVNGGGNSLLKIKFSLKICLLCLFISVPVFAGEIRNYNPRIGDAAGEIVNDALDDSMLNKEDYFTNSAGDYIYKGNRKIEKEKVVSNAKLNRLENMYNFFVNLHLEIKDFPKLEIPNWKKLEPIDKVKALKNWLLGLKAEYREMLNNMDFTSKGENIERFILKAEDDFREKVEGLPSTTKTSIIKRDNGPDIIVKTTTYTGKDGKEYIEQEYDYQSGNPPRRFLMENGMAYADYIKVSRDFKNLNTVWYDKFSETGEKQEYSSSKGFTYLPKGYVVARDRSKHLSGNEKGKKLIVPLDTKLLPEGTILKQDKKGGYIVETSSSDAYKENGNLKLKPDLNLLRVTEISKRRYYEGSNANEKVDVLQFMSAKDDFGKYGPTLHSAERFDYYSSSTVGLGANAKYKSTNFEQIGNEVTDININGTTNYHLMDKINAQE